MQESIISAGPDLGPAALFEEVYMNERIGEHLGRASLNMNIECYGYERNISDCINDLGGELWQH